MAHHKSALKRIRRNGRRAEINVNRRSRVRTFLRKVEESIASGDRGAAQAALRAAEPELMRAAGRIVHRNAASRTVSRLSARIKAMPA